MYEDNDKDLTEERIRMIKANIPEFKIVGEVKLTEEKKKEGKETLLRFIKEREYFIKERERKQLPCFMLVVVVLSYLLVRYLILIKKKQIEK